jgi:hypothetical protein
MDHYLLLLFAIYAVVVVAVVFISNKYGYKLPLTLSILALLVSIYFMVKQPKASIIFEEPVSNAVHNMGLYLGLLFAFSFFVNAFYLYRKSKTTEKAP